MKQLHRAIGAALLSVLVAVVYLHTPPFVAKLQAALALDGSCHNNATTGTSLACTLTTTQSADIVACSATVNGTIDGGPNVSGVSSAGTTGWAARGKAVTPTTTSTIETWYGTAASTISESVTVSFAGTPTYMTIDCFGISGADTTTKFDSNGGLPVQTSTAPQNMSTSNANDILIAASRGVSACTAASGWTAVGTPNHFQCVAYKIVAATQTNLSVGSQNDDATVNGQVLDAVIQSGGVVARPPTLPVLGVGPGH